LLIRSGITNGKGEGRTDDIKGDTKDSNYLIRLEHCKLTLFSALCFKPSKNPEYYLLREQILKYSKNGYGTIPSYNITLTHPAVLAAISTSIKLLNI
jgi:hypothetical protein